MAIPISPNTFSWDILTRETTEIIRARLRRLQFNKYLTEIENAD